MLLENAPSPYIFTGNPFIIEEPAGSTGTGTLTVSIGRRPRRTVFEARFTSPLRVNLADIVNGLAPDIQDPTTGSTCLEQNIPASRILSWSVFKDGEENDEVGSKVIFSGAVSKRKFRAYSEKGTDVFAERFLNAERNFFMLPMQPEETIELKETELESLVFLAVDEESSLVVNSVLGNVSRELDIDGPGVYQLDIAEIRQQMAEDFGVLPSVFKIQRNGSESCTIVITPAMEAPERYYLRYRNSYGVFERIELVGELIVKPEAPSDDNSTFKRYDPEVDDFVTCSRRTSQTVVLTAKTGPKGRTDTLRLMDALRSDEVYLLGLASKPIRVLPEAEDISLNALMFSPKGFSLTLTINEEDLTFEPDDVVSAKVRGIFTNQFTSQFK